MAWEWDQPPINYLERRVIFYEKKIAKYKNYKAFGHLIKEHGRKEVKDALKRQVQHYETRVKEFNAAIDILLIEELSEYGIREGIRNVVSEL